MRRVYADLRAAGSRLRGAAVAACCAVLVAFAGVFSGGGVADAAAAASVSISPSSTTVASGTPVTYTLSVTCSVTGGCDGTTVMFPSTSITGDGSTTDFGSWVGPSSCAGVTKTVSGGVVTFTYGSIPTGTSQCTFMVAPPKLNTMNGTNVTITPTISGSNFTSSTAPSATLTVTASPQASFSKAATASTTPGGRVSYQLSLYCGPGTGALGTSSVTMTDVLPANFTYSSSSTYYSDPNGESGTLPGTVTYDAATHTITYSDPTGKTCQSPIPRASASVEVDGTAAAAGVPDPIGSTIANTANAAWTYLDGTTASKTSPATTNVVSLIPTPFLSKGAVTTSLPNVGQYKFPLNGISYPYAYPGNWNGAGTAASYSLSVSTNSPDTGVGFALQDPLPCLDNFSGQVYSSPPPGAPYCANPAFIPTLITVGGFTPTAADAITIVYTNGTSASIPYAPGTGWAIPASPAVAEIDFPQFPEEGSNTSTVMTFTVKGYAAPATTYTTLETNTVTANAYLVGSTTPLVPQETASNSFMVVSPSEPSGTVELPVLYAGYNGTGTCTESVPFTAGNSQNSIEIASAPSQAIYIDYLAPAGATVTNGQTAAFTLWSIGAQYTTAPITATTTPNYNGTGRTLYQWVIPAGTITQTGVYAIQQAPLTVSLGAGCDGTYQNDMTVGYGAPITGCIDPGGLTPPSNPTANTDLHSNGTPLTGNYCGYSAPLEVAAVNPAFSVDKTAQGNLDAVPVSAGGVGNVSPSGGTATYDVTFTNTGQANLANPVMYDLLPAVGDTYNTSLGARGSQFGVSLTGVGPVPPGVTVSYSTAANPCRPEVLPTNPGCTSDWTTTPPSPLSSVTALKFAYTGTVYVSGGAGATTFSIPFTVSTPSGITGQVAWNTVGATATAGTTAMAPAESSRTGLQAAPSVLGLVKSAAPAQVHAAGDVISYRFAVTNNTTVTLASVAVTDAQAAPAGSLDGPVTCADTTLTAGASTTCTATYTVTQADVDNGSVNDSATASGTPPSGGAVTSPPSTASVAVAQAPAITIVKSAPSAQVHAAGDVIGYQFLVTNTGNVTLASVAVADAQAAPAGSLDGPVTCADTTLAAGASTTCTATYTVTQADVDNGSVNDSATASGTPPSGPAVTSPPSAVSVPVPAGPAITIVKSATPAQVHAAGDVITYRFAVTNAGNDTLTSVAVADAQAAPAGSLDGPVTCPDTTLAPGASTTCTGTYTVTQADIDHGSVSDSATASGTPPSGPPVTSPPAGVPVLVVQAPAITVVKSASTVRVTYAGQRVRYSFLVTDAGNVTLRDVAVTDVVAAPSGPAGLSRVTCPDATLAPGASETCTGTYTVTQADIDHGSVTDSATASGTPPSGPPVTSPPSGASVRAVQAPALRMVKTAAPARVHAPGDVIRYLFTVTNAGNVTLTRITVSDPRLAAAGITVRCPRARLAPGRSEVCTPSRAYVVTRADAARGTVGNTAIASAATPSGRVTRSRPVSVSVRVAPRALVIPTGEGASVAAPGASPGLAAAGTAALATGAVLLLLGRARRRRRT